VRRREFIAGLGSGAAWPLMARAQQTRDMRRIGVLMAFDENDPEPKSWLSGFVKALAELGWTDGRNLSMNVRWAAGNADRMRMFAKELADLQPDLIIANSTPVTASLQRETRTIPIVFVAVSDPVGSGFVAGLPAPGGNITGFADAETAMIGKWQELLTAIAPGVKRVAAMFNPDTASGGGSFFLLPLEAAARLARVHNDAEIEQTITSIGHEPGGGLVAIPDGFMVVHRRAIILQAARNNVPAVYWQSIFVKDGGLLSYGPDYPDLFRRAATYVDRILHGTKPSELPVQLPVKFGLAININTAKGLGLVVPEAILLRADDVIE
jgi:putative tryptophan/tyrosine transport system substrate-binding protein